MKSFREVRNEVSQQYQGDEHPPIACMVCKAPTKRPTLNTYGARCFRCYETFLSEKTPSPDVGDKRDGGPKAWAYALRYRVQNGERLSTVQQNMMRAAIGHESP